MILAGVTGAFAAGSNPVVAVNRHLQCVADNVAKLDDGKMTTKELAVSIIQLRHGEHVAAMQATNGFPGTPDVEQAHTMAAVAMARARLSGRKP